MGGYDFDLAGFEAGGAQSPEPGFGILVKIGVFVRVPLFDLGFSTFPLVRLYQTVWPLESRSSD